MGVFMNYFIREIVEKNAGFTFEIMIALIVAVMLFLAIIILTIIKKLKD